MTNISSLDELFVRVRLPGDESSSPAAVSYGTEIAELFLNELFVQDSVTPGLAAQSKVIATRLGMQQDQLKIFVYASPYYQAECRHEITGKCVLRISSSLIEALGEDEVNFVIGHEIGHYLLGHLVQFDAGDTKNLEDSLIARRRELTADRLGLIACGSLGGALSAMIKTVSGLSGDHLRIDVAGFISQLRDVGTPLGISEAVVSSHPAFIIRCRALLWFSMAFNEENGSINLDHRIIDEANKRVLADLDRYLERPAAQLIKAVERELTFWNSAMQIVRKKVFTKQDQQEFNQKFGDEYTDKFKRLLSIMSPIEAETECAERVAVARSELKRIAPRLYARINTHPD